MIAIPLIYFLLLSGFFYRRNGWGLDVASCILLVAISFFAVVIDIKDLYGIYGINRMSYNIWTLLLFCVQWTLTLLPLHEISAVKIEKIDDVKLPSLKVLCVTLFVCSLFLIYYNMEDLKDAMIMDLADVRDQHYSDLEKGGKSSTFNPLLIIPNILTSTPFPTIALVLWFYMNSMVEDSFLFKTLLLLASIVQAVLSIVIAGRAAMIYWAFDFFLCYSLFYRFLMPAVRRILNIVAIAFGTLFVVVFVAITISRFDGETSDRDPLDSLYGYAGQHINNFSIMMQEGHSAPLLFDREFPFVSKYFLNKSFDLKDHYAELAESVKATMNVFDTYGAEVYLDLGWLAYLLSMFLLWFVAFYIKTHWDVLSFDRLLLVGIMVSFFSHGLFAWPFIGHYASMAIVFVIFLVYYFRFRFEI